MDNAEQAMVPVRKLVRKFLEFFPKFVAKSDFWPMS